jgi:hypothetical protein
LIANKDFSSKIQNAEERKENQNTEFKQISVNATPFYPSNLRNNMGFDK